MIARYFSQAANRTGPRGADGLCRWLGGHAIADSFRKQHPRRKIVPSHASPKIATPGFESSFLRLRSLAPAGKRLVQGKAKQLIHEMYLSPTRKAALAGLRESSSPVNKPNSQRPVNAWRKIKKSYLAFTIFRPNRGIPLRILKKFST
jgi:hypothetical protein